MNVADNGNPPHWCAGEISNYGLGGQCGFTGRHEHQGKLYCAKHFPPTVEAKKVAKEKQRQAIYARTQREEAIQRFKERVVEAARDWRETSVVEWNCLEPLALAIDALIEAEEKQ